MSVIFSKQDVYNKAVHARLMMVRSTKRSAVGVRKTVLLDLNVWRFIRGWIINTRKYAVPREWQAIVIPLNTDFVRQCITMQEIIKGFLLNRVLDIARKVVDQYQFSFRLDICSDHFT